MEQKHRNTSFEIDLMNSRSELELPSHKHSCPPYSGSREKWIEFIISCGLLSQPPTFTSADSTNGSRDRQTGALATQAPLS